MAPGEENALRANVAMQRALGARAEVIGAAELKELAAGLHTGDIGCAAWEPHGGYGDGAVVAGDLVAAARERGVGYRPHTAVRALIRRGDRVIGGCSSCLFFRRGMIHRDWRIYGTRNLVVR